MQWRDSGLRPKPGIDVWIEAVANRAVFGYADVCHQFWYLVKQLMLCEVAFGLGVARLRIDAEAAINYLTQELMY